MKNVFKNKQRGIGLIEVILSIGISTVVITSLISLNLFTLRSSLRKTLSAEAISSNSKQIEMVRAYRDTVSWNEFKSALEENCSYSTIGSNLAKCRMSTNQGLNIEILSPLDELPIDEVYVGFYVTTENGVVSVTSISTYIDGEDTKTITLRADFTNWQRR